MLMFSLFVPSSNKEKCILSFPLLLLISFWAQDEKNQVLMTNAWLQLVSV